MVGKKRERNEQGIMIVIYVRRCEPIDIVT